VLLVTVHHRGTHSVLIKKTKKHKFKKNMYCPQVEAMVVVVVDMFWRVDVLAIEVRVVAMVVMWQLTRVQKKKNNKTTIEFACKKG
jgi:hypothetical protein